MRVKCVQAAYVAYSCNPSTQDTETRGLKVLGEPCASISEILTQNTNKCISAKLSWNPAGLIGAHSSQATYITWTLLWL